MTRGVDIDDGDLVLHQGDALEVLRTMTDESVDCCVTSPPYFGLRDYGADGQIGLEDTLADYLARLVEVFDEVRRVLAPHGTCWVNIGDSYARDEAKGGSGTPNGRNGRGEQYRGAGLGGLKPKDQMLVPERLGLALQDAGWWVRKRIIWAKPNPMPESVTDRPTSAHEIVWMLTKSARYWYDAEAVRQEWADGIDPSRNGGANLRDVWTIPTQQRPEAHFATFPDELVRRCIEAGCAREVCRECGAPRERIVKRAPTRPGVTGGATPYDSGRPDGLVLRSGGFGGGLVHHAGWTNCDCEISRYRPGVVLDPFVGSGTTCEVARRYGRRSIGIDLNSDYLKIAAERTRQLSLMGQEPAV